MGFRVSGLGLRVYGGLSKPWRATLSNAFSKSWTPFWRCFAKRSQCCGCISSKTTPRTPVPKPESQPCDGASEITALNNLGFRLYRV